MNPAWLEGTIRALLMAGGAGLVLAVLRVRQPRARHGVWLAVLLTMWLAWGPKITVPVLPALPLAPVWSGMDADFSLSTAGAAAPAAPVDARRRWTLEEMLRAVWLGGAFLMLAHLLWGTLRICRMRGRARRDGEVLVSARCASPVTVGWLRPAVVMPEGWREWPASKRDAALAHEGEHARRRDPLVQWLAALNRCVFWFHPLAWWLERRLAVLAEEACDDAVLARGLDAGDYSSYLIEVARSVRESHWRLDAAMHGGRLAERIGRLMTRRPDVPAPPRRTAAALGCSVVVLLVVGACQAGRAPGQPTMNELMHRSAKKRMDDADAQRKKRNDVLAMTRAQASELEQEFKRNPSDREKQHLLREYYQAQKDWPAIIALTLWHIEHHPEIGWYGYFTPDWDRAAYERGKRMWLTHLARPGIPPEVYRNAAEYLLPGDAELAGRTLERGLAAHPTNQMWTDARAGHFARVLTGKENQSAYARLVRQTLERSSDPILLGMTARSLYFHSSAYRRNGPSAEYRAIQDYAVQLCERALALKPDYAAARRLVENARSIRAWERVSKEGGGAVTASEHMLALRFQLQRGGFSAFADEPTASRLLDLARKHPDDAEQARSVYAANIALGAAAIKRGDKRTAARHLLAAVDVSGAALKRGEGFTADMTLARQLVDWGEREAVAKYLDKCAAFVERGDQLKEWAAQIRKGINPDLVPYSSGS